jgi:hypothetical protein
VETLGICGISSRTVIVLEFFAYPFQLIPKKFLVTNKWGRADDPDLYQEEAKQQQKLAEASYLASLIPEEEIE